MRASPKAGAQDLLINRIEGKLSPGIVNIQLEPTLMTRRSSNHRRTSSKNGSRQAAVSLLKNLQQAFFMAKNFNKSPR